MFVQFSDITGECEERGHRGWCEITSLDQNFSNPTLPPPPGTTEIKGAKPCKHSEIKITKLVDTASVQLMEACWKGRTVDTVVIECFRAGKGLDNKELPIKYFSIELENVIIRELDYSVDEGDLVTEELELVAGKASYAYRQMDKELGTAVLAKQEDAKIGKTNLAD